jgi:tetratricopeptide (TPR) repeat protein
VTESRRRAACAALIAVATLALYAPVRALPFLRYDDEQYVTGNSAVQAGLGLAGVRWAFTSDYASNWHPLTWLSHMLDVTLFGESPVGPHVENALLHALNAALVFAVLVRLTGATGRSALAAALFAVHPQHVESVAWVAERKDLLCALFALLALTAWPSWARGGSRAAYAAALACMALGLLAKPMLVSLPLLLLVLDFWPLARPWGARLVLEKLPFAALSVGSSLATLHAQAHAMQLDVPFLERVANACVALAVTLAQTFAPLGLAVLYPHPFPGHWAGAEVALAAALVIGLGALGLALRRRAPYVLAGGSWFALALAPTVGLVQVGFQSHADRYAYLPQIGVAWAVAWAASDLWARVRAPRAAGVALAAAAALALAFVTRGQLEYWKSDVALWQRAVAAARPSYYAETELAIELVADGSYAESLPHFERAVQINPRWSRAQANYGFALYLEGDANAATQRFERALEIEPNPNAASEWHLYYARSLAAVGRPEEAIAHYQRQIELDPSDRGALLGLAELRATQPEGPLRHGPQALELAERACQIAQCARPEEIDILALAIAAAGQPDSAATVEEEALRRASAMNATETRRRIEAHLAEFRAGRAVTETR